MRRVCVFCGSSFGTKPDYAASAEALGRLIAQSGLGLVYGGGNVGLMGVLADAMLELGGEVTGIIPETLVKAEVAHQTLTQLHVVKSMHERKAMMADLSDAFIAAPGGIGTLEELFEIWTWGQLGLHHKPLGFYDVEQYYSPLMDFLDHAHAEGFLRAPHRKMVILNADPLDLLDELACFQHPGSIFSVP